MSREEHKKIGSFSGTCQETHDHHRYLFNVQNKCFHEVLWFSYTPDEVLRFVLNRVLVGFFFFISPSSVIRKFTNIHFLFTLFLLVRFLYAIISRLFYSFRSFSPFSCYLNKNLHYLYIPYMDGATCFVIFVALLWLFQVALYLFVVRGTSAQNIQNVRSCYGLIRFSALVFLILPFCLTNIELCPVVFIDLLILQW